MDREQAIKEYGMDDEFIQAVINSDGTLDMAIEQWNKDRDGIVDRCNEKIHDGMGMYDAYKAILVEGIVVPVVAEVVLERANRISVQTTDEGIIATYWRTHKKVGIITVVEAMAEGFVADPTLNKTATRELFRVWMCNNADRFGIKYDPADNRQPTNIFPSKYTSDDLLTEWSKKIVINDIFDWTNKVAEEYKSVVIVTSNIDTDNPLEVTNRNGKDVSPKYGNGNWAYATIPVTATVQVIEGENANEGYVTMMVQLVSGQMKKPTNIGEGGYNYTSYKEELLKDIKGFLPVKEDKKDGKGKSKDDPKPSEAGPIIDKVAETVTEEPKPKKERKSRTKKDPKVTPDPKKGTRKASTKEKKMVENKDVDNSKWNKEEIEIK
jgi:hypothetical protein